MALLGQNKMSEYAAYVIMGLNRYNKLKYLEQEIHIGMNYLKETVQYQHPVE
jgi:hypothetical protein